MPPVFKKHWIIFSFCLLCVILFLILPGPFNRKNKKNYAESHATLSIIRQIMEGISLYKKQYPNTGLLPFSNKALCRILTGSNDEGLNPDKITFIEFKEGLIDSNGNITDIWGRPIVICRSNKFDNHVVLVSYGANGLNDNLKKDDVYWVLSPELDIFQTN